MRSALLILTEILLCHFRCFLLSPEALSPLRQPPVIMTMGAGLALRALVAVEKCDMAPVLP